MEIIFEKLKQLKEKVYSVPNYLPKDVHIANVDCFDTEGSGPLSDEDNQILTETIESITHLLNDDVFYDLYDEIELNIVNMSTDSGVIRYLSYLQEQAKHLREMLESYYEYDNFSALEARINDREWIWTGRKEYRNFLESLARKANANGGTYKHTDEENELHRMLKERVNDVKQNQLGHLLSTYLYSIQQVRELSSSLDHKITLIQNPDKPMEFSGDLNANTHRLLLFHKMGLFQPLFNSHYNTLGAVRFTRLVATLLGIQTASHEGFRPSVTELIKVMGNASARTNIQTPAAEKKVNAFLAEIGILNNA